uniref:Uncharacterized protein n=1 Tax=Arundo donax TaxID=35708 RepID=A0A0A9AQQ0_ARUDO
MHSTPASGHTHQSQLTISRIALHTSRSSQGWGNQYDTITSDKKEGDITFSGLQSLSSKLLVYQHLH